MDNQTDIQAAKQQPDTLLESLVTLTRIHQKPYSAESLIAGLPLVDGRLTPELFVRAAQQGDFEAKYLKRDLTDISEQVLPVVLILNNGHACVMLERLDGSARVIFPASGQQPKQVGLTELEERYSGSAIYFKPAYQFDKSASATESAEDHWFWSVIRKSRAIYAEVLVASLLVNIFALVTPLFIMNVYDRVVPNQAIETLWVLASGVGIVFVFDLIMKSLRGYFIDVAGKRSDILLSSRTFSKVMDIQMKARPASVGSFANNLQEFDGFREFFTSTTLITLIDLPFTLLFIFIIYSVGGIVAWVPLLAIPVILVIGLSIQRPLQSLVSKTFTESARKHAMLIETLNGLDTIKGVRAEGITQQKWEGFNARIAKLSLRSRLLSLAAINFSQIIQQLATVLVVIIGVYQIIAAELSIGGLIACTILTGRALAPMGQIASILTRYHHSMAAFGSINSIMRLPTERPTGRKFLHRPKLSGDINFRGVSFSYENQPTPALQNINLHISQGEKVGIVGRMGSGKTTLQRLILNFYQPQEGAILMDGTDINQLDPTDLRRNIGYVPQDILLFNGTIRDNIVIGNPQADDKSVLKAATVAGLAEFVNQHPNGFDLLVGERGARLSGGQRQAIAIARILLHDPSIMLLDEPTNAMDNTTEINFTTHIKPIIQDKTLVLITHKASMLNLVDRLIVINDGKIVSDGPKEDVIKALAGA
jgi:ATP-binding cassette subfamily C protein LapB